MKRAYILMTPLFLADLCKPSDKRTISIKSDVPKNATFITAEYSDSKQCFRVIFEHDSFEDIPEGNLIPMMEAPVFTCYYENGSET